MAIERPDFGCRHYSNHPVALSNSMASKWTFHWLSCWTILCPELECGFSNRFGVSAAALASALDANSIILNHAGLGRGKQTVSKVAEEAAVNSRIQKESCMRSMALFTGITLSLTGLALATAFPGYGNTARRYGSWQELSAAQPTCSSMTNLTSLSPSGADGLQCSVLVPCAHQDWICADGR